MARNVIEFNKDWYFTKEQIDPASLDMSAMEPVTLPHTWNALDGQDGGGDYYRGICWYAKKFTRPQGEQIWAEFGAVSQIAVVYVNGNKVGRHAGGISRFRFDITPYLNEGENILVVSADNGENDETYPQFADFTFYGGIYRDVHLITVPKQHFDLDYYGTQGIAVTPSLEEDGSATVRIDVYAKAGAGAQVRYTVKDAEGNTIGETTAGDTTWTLKFDEPQLWEGRKSPYLYAAQATLLATDGSELDAVSTRFGLRRYAVDPEKGFFLNGRHCPLRGVSRHQCREDIGWALTTKEQDEDIEIIAEMGVNSIRLAHYQHNPYFYDLCDEYGMVVWAEIPFISSFMDSPQAYENTMSQMRELVLQNYNNPSICFWGIANEISIGGDDDPALNRNLEALNALCHELDPGRLTTIANLSIVENDSPHNHITDVVAYNHYFGWYAGDVDQNGPWFDDFHSGNPAIAVGLSEYGAEGNIHLHSETPEVRDYTEEYQCVYHEGMLQTFATRPYIWGTYVWNMFEFGSDMRDEGMVQGRNNKGLVNFSRTVKKDAYYLYKAYWTDEPFVYICGRRFFDRCGDSTGIKVYAAGVDEVALHVNGRETGRLAGRYVFAFTGVVLDTGKNEVQAVGYSKGQKVAQETISLNRVETPNPSYSMPEEEGTAGADSVANWFDEGYGQKELTFNEGYFSIKDRFGEVMESPQGEALINTMMQAMAGAMSGGDKKTGGIKINKGMLKMVSRMTFEDLTKMAGKRMPTGTLAAINEQLQQIKKP